MWPLYAPSLLLDIPKYPVSQYLTLSFRDLGFYVIQSNLLSNPDIVGSRFTMLLVTAFGELVNNRSFVLMAKDAWLLPCFAALIALKDPISGREYFTIAIVLLSFPWRACILTNCGVRADKIQHASPPSSLDVQKRWLTLFVRVSGMLGANSNCYILSTQSERLVNPTQSTNPPMHLGPSVRTRVL